jgi:hypothetical protein
MEGIPAIILVVAVIGGIYIMACRGILRERAQKEEQRRRQRQLTPADIAQEQLRDQTEKEGHGQY